MPESSPPASAPAAEFPIGPEIEASARKAWGLGLCPECLGRLFGRHGHGLSNPERAARLAAGLGQPVPTIAEGGCSLCRGLFDRWEIWIERARRASEELEWRRFACGSRWDPEILAREETIAAEIGATHPESARGAFNREWGKRLEARTGRIGAPNDPEVVLVADLPAGRVEVTVLPIYIRGRYRKLDRSIPQTRWPCRRCEGRGCDQCAGTGKTYPTSVEELVAQPFLEATLGEGTRFHGMGREDIDARMLGRGRPFVLEVLRPKKRDFDLLALCATAGRASGARIEIVDPRLATAADVVAVKEASPEKSYRVQVRGEVPVAKINEALTFVTDRAIAQRTPTRVAHRRSDLVRSRRIRQARLVEASEGRFTLDLRAEAGTYIKEWVEGDGGRTEPNLSGLLGTPVTVESLDVLEIHDTE
ncbi:MAG TPA: tRNA pseudouridine(54/55) synthase Pus10 [Thermoplasmata archaeon]|nr:tRNA pseudouridine(54/55) synthase Pus10 [Thermoplasmata archaeon]